MFIPYNMPGQPPSQIYPHFKQISLSDCTHKILNLLPHNPFTWLAKPLTECIIFLPYGPVEWLAGWQGSVWGYISISKHKFTNILYKYIYIFIENVLVAQNCVQYVRRRVTVKCANNTDTCSSGGGLIHPPAREIFLLASQEMLLNKQTNIVSVSQCFGGI